MLKYISITGLMYWSLSELSPILTDSTSFILDVMSCIEERLRFSELNDSFALNR